MMKRCAALVAGISLFLAADARAQEIGAGDALINILLGKQNEGALTADVIAALAVVLQSEATTFPLASSSGGFTWTFDPTLGVQTRRSQSFGPMFAERPLTNGRRKFNVGVAYQHTAYDSFAGESLSALKTVFTYPELNNLVETYSSDLSFKTDRTIISASYGVHDRVDVSVLVPLEHTTASGSSAYKLRLNGSDLTADQCVVFSDQSRLCPYTTNSKGTSSGIGDIILRGKVAVTSTPMLDLAVGLDVRLPTGDDEQLLGVGKRQTKLMVMGATTRGGVSPHFNVGYTFSGKGIPFDADGNVKLWDDVTGEFNSAAFEPSDEVSYTFGADVAATPSITIMGDVIGRSLRNSAKFDFVTSGGDSYFTVSPATLNLILGTIGAKVKIGSDFLITASVVFPLNSAGVKPGITPVIGFERAF
jgi:Putative MetA-pathway of phenol degradation